MSDVVATTQDVGAASGEDQFQGLWDSGAFDPNGIPPKEVGGQEHEASAGHERTQDDDRLQGQEQEQGTQEQEGTEKDAPTYASLNEMLAAHKIDPESVMGLHVTAKIDGVETQVPLSDVLK